MPVGGCVSGDVPLTQKELRRRSLALKPMKLRLCGYCGLADRPCL